MDNRVDKELDWDSEISYEATQIVVLPDGVYPFTITKLERKRYNGRSGGLPPCPMAEVTVEATGKDGMSRFTQRLYLHSRCEGILTSFFTSIGKRKHGEKLSMDWNQVEGSHGWAMIQRRTFTSNSTGEEVTVNDVKWWLAPDDRRIPKDDGGEDW